MGSTCSMTRSPAGSGSERRAEGRFGVERSEGPAARASRAWLIRMPIRMPLLLPLLLLSAALASAEGAGPLAPSTAHAADCEGTSVGLTPLGDLGEGVYKGEDGGLYGGGRNQPPAAHLAEAERRAGEILPRDAAGDPVPAGKIVLLSIGLSNTTQEWQRFMQLAQGDGRIHPALQIVDGAQGGVAASQAADPDDPYWDFVDERLQRAGVSHAQVQAVWMKTARRSPRADDAGDTLPEARALEANMRAMVNHVHDRFPNALLLYASSRIYAGYASSPLNPEPFAYESALALRWLIQGQIDGDADLNPDPTRGASRAPLLLWGPYLWADGLNPRSDGLIWECDDFAEDGTHPGTPGRQKVAQMLLGFFESDTTSRGWFLADPDATAAPSATADPAGTPTSAPTSERPTRPPRTPGATPPPGTPTGGLRSFRLRENPTGDRMWVATLDEQAQRRLEQLAGRGRDTFVCGWMRVEPAAEWGWDYDPAPGRLRVLPDLPEDGLWKTIREFQSGPITVPDIAACIRVDAVLEMVDGPPPGGGQATATVEPTAPASETPTAEASPTVRPDGEQSRVFLPMLFLREER